MRIGIMCPGIAKHDAVGNDAVGMYRALKHAGHDVHLMTPNGTSASPYTTWKYADADWLFSDPESLIVYHYCTADPSAISVLQRLPCRLALRYHNVTPSHFMAPFSLDFALACKAGRRGIGDMLSLPFDFILSDSQYNSDELISRGYPESNIEVLPPFHCIDELLSENEEHGTVIHLRKAHINIVSVGRIVPNKGHALMIEAMATVKKRGIDATLHLIGGFDRRLSTYSDMLQDKICKLNVEDRVQFHPVVPGNALASYYRHSDVFWTASQHEGFCVPAIEAMAFGLPIISSTRGALPSTCGDAALYADTPVDMAKFIENFAEDDDLRIQYGQRGKERYRAFKNREIGFRLLELVERRWVEKGLTTNDWFGLPDPNRVESLARRYYSKPTLTEGHRRAAIAAVLVNAGSDPEACAYFSSPDVRAYANEVSIPQNGARLSPASKLLWTFSGLARSRFPLHDAENASAYWSWFRRWASVALSPLMSARERELINTART